LVNKILDNIADAISSLETKVHVRDLVQVAIKHDIPIMEIVEEGLRKGLDQINGYYENGEYFLAELLYSGQLIQDAFDFVKPYLPQGSLETQGTILIAAVQGDLHDIGKNVFKTLAEIAGFTIIDLGVDVAPATIIQALKEYHPPILGLSVLLTTAVPGVQDTITSICTAGLRDSTKIIIGGNAVDKEVAQRIGADAAADNALDGIKICKNWM
jgi:methanogenic corrinoid protein MtbC1